MFLDLQSECNPYRGTYFFIRKMIAPPFLPESYGSSQCSRDPKARYDRHQRHSSRYQSTFQHLDPQHHLETEENPAKQLPITFQTARLLGGVRSKRTIQTICQVADESALPPQWTEDRSLNRKIQQQQHR